MLERFGVGIETIHDSGTSIIRARLQGSGREGSEYSTNVEPLREVGRPFDSMRSSSTPLRLIVVWAALLITLIALRPSPHSFLFWLLAASVLVSGGAYMLVSHLENRQIRLEVTAWIRKLDQLVDVRDFEDDGHLPEYLDESERRRIVEELERMPRGARSLRRAISIVSPDLLRDDAS